MTTTALGPPAMPHGFAHDPHPAEPTIPEDGVPDDGCRRVPAPEGVGEVDDRFVFDFRPYDDLEVAQRWSTWLSVEPLCRGPSRVRTGW